MCEVVTLVRSYRYRLEPTADQQSRLFGFAGTRRFVWNWALAARKAYYAQYGHGMPKAELSAEFTALKSQPDTAWLRQIDSQLPQQALRDLDRAFVNFFEKRARYPRFKTRKGSTPSFRIPQRVRLRGTEVIVPKIGPIRVRLYRPLEGTVKSATFKCDATGHWFVTFVSHVEMPDVALPPPQRATTAGIDLGLKSFAVLSTGETVANPRFYRKAARRLRREHRSVSRKARGSANRNKARDRLARVYRRTANARHDFLHQLSAKWVRQYDTICIEDLAVAGLAKTKLGKSVYDAGWGALRRMLAYKTAGHRKRLIVIDRWFPSSRTCGACGRINADLTLGDRVWTCACGTVLDRDLNAALNIAAEGWRLLAPGYGERENACGLDVRPATGGLSGLNQEATRL